MNFTSSQESRLKTLYNGLSSYKKDFKGLTKDLLQKDEDQVLEMMKIIKDEVFRNQFSGMSQTEKDNY